MIIKINSNAVQTNFQLDIHNSHKKKLNSLVIFVFSTSRYKISNLKIFFHILSPDVPLNSYLG